MKIVVLDGYTCNPGDLSWDMFKEFGTIEVHDRTPESEVISRVQDAEVAFTNKVKLTKEVLLAAKNLKLIVVLAAGYDVVDIVTAKELGIVVCNTPAYGSKGVGQMVFAHILEITNNVALHSDSVKKGEWASNVDWCYWHKRIIDLYGKKIGIIGYGNIGKEVAKIAEGFSMEVLPYDTDTNMSLDEVFKQSDIITLHCPLTPETKEIINKQNIAKMKKGVIIINASRGPLVNEKDLVEAVKSGHVYAAGVDVITIEPPTEVTEYISCDGINITPHIAWASTNSRSNIINIAYNNVKAFIEGSNQNVVNK